MSEAELKQHLNPDSLLTDVVEVIDLVSRPVPPGTKAPSRPPGRERVPGSELPITEPFEIFECKAIPVPPGTKAPPRAPGRERQPSSAPDEAQATRIEAELASIQLAATEANIGRVGLASALSTIQAAITRIKLIQGG